MNKFKKRFEPIVVECYSGHKVNETPRKFIARGKEYIVDRAIERWCEQGINFKSPQLEYFKVLDREKREYILRYNVKSDTWEILW